MALYFAGTRKSFNKKTKASLFSCIFSLSLINAIPYCIIYNSSICQFLCLLVSSLYKDFMYLFFIPHQCNTRLLYIQQHCKQIKRKASITSARLYQHHSIQLIANFKMISSTSAYLILVISFTLAGFLNHNILHPKITKNTQKLHEIAPKSVTYAVFRFESGNFYTGQNFFTQAPPVVPVTNMRYGQKMQAFSKMFQHEPTQTNPL